MIVVFKVLGKFYLRGSEVDGSEIRETIGSKFVTVTTWRSKRKVDDNFVDRIKGKLYVYYGANYTDPCYELMSLSEKIK